MSGRQLTKADERSERLRHELIVEVHVHRARIKRKSLRQERQDCLDFRGEAETAAISPVEERLLAAPVASEKERARSVIPDGNREHPAEPLHARCPPALIGRQDHLGVGRGAEGSTGGDQFVSQFDVVIDFAVEYDREPAAAHGLPTGLRQVDDRQPAVAQGDVLGCKGSAVVWAAMSKPRNIGLGEPRRLAASSQYAEDSAHSVGLGVHPRLLP